MYDASNRPAISLCMFLLFLKIISFKALDSWFSHSGIDWDSDSQPLVANLMDIMDSSFMSSSIIQIVFSSFESNYADKLSNLYFMLIFEMSTFMDSSAPVSAPLYSFYSGSLVSVDLLNFIAISFSALIASSNSSGVNKSFVTCKLILYRWHRPGSYSDRSINSDISLSSPIKS